MEDGKILAAVIGASAAIIGVLIRDVLIRYVEYRRDQNLSALKVFRKYADPLVNATTSLLWRMDEILNKAGRGSFLMNEKYQTRFAEYKRLSTIYRLASLLGWIRAYRRELSFLRTSDESQLTEIKNSISELEGALADGSHVEMNRLRALLDLWNTKFKSDYPNMEKVAVVIDHELKDFIQKENCKVAIELESEKQFELSKKIANLLSDYFQIEQLSNKLLNETITLSMEVLSLKEAWLYRDWQSAIGDMMISETESSDRRFDVIGYYDFEKIIITGDELHKMWFERLNNLIYNLDASGNDKSDVRIHQLQKTLVASAKLIKCLVEKDKQQKKLLSSTLDLASEIIKKASNSVDGRRQ